MGLGFRSKHGKVGGESGAWLLAHRMRILVLAIEDKARTLKHCEELALQAAQLMKTAGNKYAKCNEARLERHRRNHVILESKF